MATLQRASLPKHFANFTNSTAGLDLTLRLIHAIVIIAADVSSDVDIVKTSLMANLQIGLGMCHQTTKTFQVQLLIP